MKILCPIDFSDSSVNSIQYALDLCKDVGGGSVELLHCVSIRSRRAGILIKLDDIMLETAEEDFEKLINQKLQFDPEFISVTRKIVSTNAMDFIPSYAGREKFDIIILGAKGITALKEMTVGSVAKAVIEKADTPVLAIPIGRKYEGFESTVVAVNGQPRENLELYKSLHQLLKQEKTSIHFFHIKGHNEEEKGLDENIKSMFEGFSSDYYSVYQADSISAEISQYCKKTNADLLCMIHKKRTLFDRIFHYSVTEDKLHDVETPLLILPS